MPHYYVHSRFAPVCVGGVHTLNEIRQFHLRTTDCFYGSETICQSCTAGIPRFLITIDGRFWDIEPAAPIVIPNVSANAASAASDDSATDDHEDNHIIVKT
jgi:hypothetical protein